MGTPWITPAGSVGIALILSFALRPSPIVAKVRMHQEVTGRPCTCVITILRCPEEIEPNAAKVELTAFVCIEDEVPKGCGKCGVVIEKVVTEADETFVARAAEEKPLQKKCGEVTFHIPLNDLKTGRPPRARNALTDGRLLRIDLVLKCASHGKNPVETCRDRDRCVIDVNSR